MQRTDAIVYCEGAFQSTNGKTAHGLVRRTERYHVRAVVDSTVAGRDAGAVLDGVARGIPLCASIQEALSLCPAKPTLVIGLAPDGGRLPDFARKHVADALELGLDVVSGLHDYLGDDPDLRARAARSSAKILDIRRPPPREQLHFFEGTIREVEAFRVAVLGTDSAVGKRTTTWMLVDALRARGITAAFIGTGQTAWLQGARHAILMDALVNDFVTGEIEHAVVSAWREERPQVILVEGQGSLLNPAYPGGFEILAAAKPHCVVLQHAPARKVYDGFPEFPMHSLRRQIDAIHAISDSPVVAVTLNAELLSDEERKREAGEMARESGLPVAAPLFDGVGTIAELIVERAGLAVHAAPEGR